VACHATQGSSLKVSSPPPEKGHQALRRLALVAVLAPALAGCADAPDHAAEKTRRARQMRDVARMLDAMESSHPSVVVALNPTSGRRADAPPPRRSAALRKSDDTPPSRWRWPFVAGGGGLATLLAVFMRRRRRQRAPTTEAPSVAPFFAEATDATEATEAPIVAEPPPAPPVNPTWVYRKTSFETPGLHMIPSAVDLLVPKYDPALVDTDTGSTYLRAFLADAAAGHGPFLIGDMRCPRLRRADATPSHLLAWRDLLMAQVDDDGDDGRLARWILPSLEVELAGDLPHRDAVNRLAAIEDEARARNARTTHAEPAFAASLVSLRLARIARMSGATRLFALRALAAEGSGTNDACVLDAHIDVLLAWSSWSLAATASARLDDADAAARRLATFEGDWSARAQHRHGDIRARRAALHRASDGRHDLAEAQRLLDDAYERVPDPETALLAARTAERRARALPPKEAATACSDALVYAFLAEQHPAWRSDAIACRHDIQHLYESLPHDPSPTNDETP